MLPTVAAMTVACVAACSPPTPPETRPGTLVRGTAQITVNGSTVGLTDQVECTVDGPSTTITTGTGQSGVTAVVAGGDSPVAESVDIHNVGGFTGRYDATPRGKPTVIATGRSYQITGTADGFTVSQPAIQTSGTFTIDVAC